MDRRKFVLALVLINAAILLATALFFLPRPEVVSWETGNVIGKFMAQRRWDVFIGVAVICGLGSVGAYYLVDAFHKNHHAGDDSS